MKIYTKPSVNVIELAIEENIALVVPKTVYKKNKGTGSAYLIQEDKFVEKYTVSIPVDFNA